MTDTDRILARIAASQGGAFTIDQAVAAGVSRSALRRRARRGGIYRRHARTYFLGYQARTIDGERWAAVLAGGADALIDGRAAAQDWGLIRGNDAPPEILVAKRQRPLVGVRCRHSVTIHAEDRATVRGRPTVSPERALVTLAGSHGVAALCRCLREGTVRKVLDLERLRRTMARNRHSKGTGRLRRALVRFVDGDGGADNRHEARFVRMLHDAGERSAIGNHDLRLNGVTIRPDVWFPDDAVAVELDEWTHGIAQIGREDRLKTALLASASIPVVRIDQNDLVAGLDITLDALRRIRIERLSHTDTPRHIFTGKR